MLAELDWTKRWKQEGIEEGLEKGRREGRKEGRQRERQEQIQKARGVLLSTLEKRFGPLTKAIRKHVEAIGSIEEITELSCRVGEASSLSDLTLG